MKSEIKYIQINKIRCEYTEYFDDKGNLDTIRIWSCKKQHLPKSFPCEFIKEISKMFKAKWTKKSYKGQNLILPIIDSYNVLHVRSVIRDDSIKRISAYVEFR